MLKPSATRQSSTLFFCSIRVVIKTNNNIANKFSAKSSMGRFYSRKDRSGG